MGLLPAGWFTDIPWLHVYVGFSLSIEAFEQYLNLRQLQRYNSNKKPPSLLSSCVSEREYMQSNAYNRDRIKLSMLSSIFQSGIGVLSTLFFFGPLCWKLAGQWAGHGEYLRPITFVAMQRCIHEIISTPFQYYSDFYVEDKHGFNKKSHALFFKDKLLGNALALVIGCPILCAVNWLIKWGGDQFYYWLWGFLVITTFGMVVIYPNLIAPLFNKFEVLKDKELRSKIEALAAELHFPLFEVYEMDGSKRSSHSNAYFYGLWRWKRIVLFDTLLHLPHNQILAILGHELGHWKKNHFIQGLAILFSNMFITLFIYSKVMNNGHLYKCFGYDENDAKSPVIGLILLGNILAPVHVVLRVLLTLHSRMNEFEADAFACKLNRGEELKEALCSVHKENKSTLDPDPWYSWWHYSHPPLPERLSAIDAILKKGIKGKENTETGSRSNSSSSGIGPESYPGSSSNTTTTAATDNTSSVYKR